MGEFEAFAQAASASGGRATAPALRSLDNVAVLGGAADGRLIAALCLSEGASVTLFSAYGAELDAMAASAGVTLRGAGPVGTYQINRENAPSISTTAQLDVAVAQADVIFLTGPVHKQRTYAMVLADHLRDGQVLVLAPGRSLGALEAAWLLRIGGSVADITLVEAQNLPFWWRKEGSVLHLSPTKGTPVATLPSGRNEVIDALGRYLPGLDVRASVLASGFEDGSALVEVPALLMGGPAAASGAPSVPMGGTELPENHNFANLIGAAHRATIAAMLAERARVAQVFGVRDLPDLQAMIDRYAGTKTGDGIRPVPDPQGARNVLRDGVIGSLVPLVSAAELAGVEIPVTRAMIALASTVLGADVAAAGRRLDTIGIRASDVSTARRAMEAIAVGQA